MRTCDGLKGFAPSTAQGRQSVSPQCPYHTFVSLEILRLCGQLGAHGADTILVTPSSTAKPNVTRAVRRAAVIAFCCDVGRGAGKLHTTATIFTTGHWLLIHAGSAPARGHAVLDLRTGFPLVRTGLHSGRTVAAMVY